MAEHVDEQSPPVRPDPPGPPRADLRERARLIACLAVVVLGVLIGVLR
ncbi:hypothetical protein [Micromonospora sp. WMMD1082]|nr:hypothetical protein [Micromonospora sp. WMMD1082]MDG4794910.1 hypothetical protein [Micromonospora sp. WMMD1082]